jgi:hypothetical protein
MPLATSRIITALSTVVSVRQVVFAEMLVARRVEEIEGGEPHAPSQS